ncbi:MAG TPA: hypothetical protein IAA05_11155 [Candidatus Blautia excrementipullorum]|nr:hypothetical protein [Candidatus Blautia excrementipullorum]
MLIFGMGAAAGGIVLQIFLSGKRSRWPGLVLPALTFFWSVVRLCMVRFYMLTLGETISMYLKFFLFRNISTLILLVIYFVIRRGNRRKRQTMLDKMNIHDLG